MAQIDTVVFDLGNVLFQWDPRHLYRRHFASEAEMEHFLATVCTLEWHLAHDYGVSFEENAACLKALHPGAAALIDLWRTGFQEMIPGPVPGTSALITALKARGHRLHGLTNMPAPVYPELCVRFPELALLEEVVVSGEEGVIKPDPRIYEILIGRTGLEPSRALFIDDSRRNVDAAAALGFHTHHFTDAEGLRADLVGRGLVA
ncbi:MAG: HAD family phosphatase [Parvibaculum sp.]|uniref:HAD family hydrolase n=1 Tax=Parvibaculum sp. TaxID=2024848 RepID=UPI003C763989